MSIDVGDLTPSPFSHLVPVGLTEKQEKKERGTDFVKNELLFFYVDLLL